MNEAKLLAELMIELHIWFESDCDDVADWLCSFNRDLDAAPMELIKKFEFENLHKYVMENMT
jgi:hypothetical protein